MRKILAGFVFCLLAPFTLAGHHEKGEMSANIMAAKAGYDAFNTGDIEVWKKHKLMTLFLKFSRVCHTAAPSWDSKL